MNKNKIASAVVLLLTTASGYSYATTQNLQFSGTVSSICSFSGVTNGTLAVSAAAPHIISTNPAAGGTPGQVTISYNATPTVTVDNITSFSSSPNISGITNPSIGVAVSGQNAGQYTWGNSVFSKTYSSGTTDVITVEFEAQTGNTSLAWPTGSYSAATTITCQ